MKNDLFVKMFFFFFTVTILSVKYKPLPSFGSVGCVQKYLRRSILYPA